MHRLHSERLQSERQEWHADLDSLLEGNFASEDLDLTITLAKCVLSFHVFTTHDCLSRHDTKPAVCDNRTVPVYSTLFPVLGP